MQTLADNERPADDGRRRDLVAAAMKLRQRDGVPRDSSMPLYPLPLLVYVVGILGICIASAIGDPAGALFGLKFR